MTSPIPATGIVAEATSLVPRSSNADWPDQLAHDPAQLASESEHSLAPTQWTARTPRLGSVGDDNDDERHDELDVR